MTDRERLDQIPTERLKQRIEQFRRDIDATTRALTRGITDLSPELQLNVRAAVLPVKTAWFDAVSNVTDKIDALTERVGDTDAVKIMALVSLAIHLGFLVASFTMLSKVVTKREKQEVCDP